MEAGTGGARGTGGSGGVDRAAGSAGTRRGRNPGRAWTGRPASGGRCCET